MAKHPAINRNVGARGTTWTYRYRTYTRDAAGAVVDTHHHRKTFRTLKAAEEFQTLHEADTRRGDVQNYDAAALPFRVFAERWLAVTRPRIKPRTYDGYADTLRLHVLPLFGERAVSAISPSDVEVFVAQLSAANKSAATIKGAVGILRRVLDVAVRDRAIRQNPAADVATPTNVSLGREKFQHNPLSEDEVDALATSLADRPPYDLMVRFLAWTGLRAAELAGLNVGDVWLWRTPAGWRGYVDVRRTRRRVKGGWETGTPKSENSTRRVDLQDWLAEDLHAYLTDVHPRSAEPNAPLWPNRLSGGHTHGRLSPTAYVPGALNWRDPVEPASFYKNLFKPALVQAGLSPRTRLHDLRHTYAALALSRGAAIYWVSEQMGHASYIITLEVYASYIPKDDVHPLNGRPARAMGSASRSLRVVT